MGVNQGRRSTGRGQRGLFGYALAAITVILISLAGYAGYVLYPRFDLPGVTVAGLFVLAAGAGVACFFSPCSFPLLVSLFGRGPAARKPDRPTTSQALSLALGLSFGAAAFLILVGSIVALVGTGVFADVVFTSTEGIILRSVVGLLLILLGLIQFGVIRMPFPPVQDLADPLIDPASRTDRVGVVRTSVFGFGYLVAGFG